MKIPIKIKRINEAIEKTINSIKPQSVNSNLIIEFCLDIAI